MERGCGGDDDDDRGIYYGDVFEWDVYHWASGESLSESDIVEGSIWGS